MGQAPGVEEGDVRQQPLNRLGAGMRNALPTESLRVVRTRISETPVQAAGVWRSTLPIQYLRFSLELNRYEIQI